MTDSYLNSMISSAITCFERDNNTPSVRDLLEITYGTLPITGAMLDDAAKKIRRIRKTLESEHGYQTCPLTEAYFRLPISKRRRLVTRGDELCTKAEQRRYLAGVGGVPGGTQRAYGILRLTGDNPSDLLWHLYQELEGDRGSAAVERTLNTVASAYDDGRLTGDNRADILSSARVRLTPGVQRTHLLEEGPLAIEG